MRALAFKLFPDPPIKDSKFSVLSRNSGKIGAMQVVSLPNSSGNEAGICRRVHPRLKCKGVARMRLLPNGSFLDGFLADLSIRGCCIELDSPSTGEPNSAVEVLLNIKGTALRLNGTIRYVSCKTRTGIQFEESSARKKEQITELMRELVEMDKAAALEHFTHENRKG